MRTRGMVAGVGIALACAGILCAPPAQIALGVEPVVLEQPVPRLISWALCAGLVAGGVALALLRSRVAPGSLALLALSTLLGMLCGEAALHTVGYTPRFRPVPHVPPEAFLRVAVPGAGDRYIPGTRPGDWPLNRDGFVDLDDFRTPPANPRARRVLLLGDSYTQGIGVARYEDAWAERLEAGLNLRADTVVWNTGIAGTGPPQYLASLRECLPVLQPDIVVLGFCQNDVLESLFPLSFMLVFEDRQWIYRHAVDARGRLYGMSPETAYRRAMHAPESLPGHLAATRVGSLVFAAAAGAHTAVLHRRHGPGRLPRDAAHPAGLEAARRIVGEMRHAIAGQGAAFMVFVVPYKSDLPHPSGRHADIVAMLRGLGIDLVDVADLFTPEDYDHTGHWLATGQSKLAGLLQCELERIFAARPGSSRAAGDPAAGGRPRRRQARRGSRRAEACPTRCRRSR